MTPVLPDLRFEVGYLRSIQGAPWYSVIAITVRDQMIFPLLQGAGWSLILLSLHSYKVNCNQYGHIWANKIRKFINDIMRNAGGVNPRKQY